MMINEIDKHKIKSQYSDISYKAKFSTNAKKKKKNLNMRINDNITENET